MRASGRVVAASLAALMAVSACSSQDPDASSDHSGSQDGRLIGGANRFGWGKAATVGQTFSDGLTVVQLTGEEPVTIERVDAALSDSGVAYLGAYIADVGRALGSVQDVPHFPPVGPSLGTLRPAEGAILEPSDEASTKGYELFLGYRVDEAGRYFRPDVEVHYRVGNDKRSLTIPSELLVCAGTTTAPQTCLPGD